MAVFLQSSRLTSLNNPLVHGEVINSYFSPGVIDKNAYSGVESLLNDINAALLAEVDRTNLKRTRRRRRRGGSKGEPPDVLLPSQVYPDKVKDIHKATQIPARKLSKHLELTFNLFLCLSL